MVVDDLATQVVGFILLPFYVLAPILYLCFVGRQVKDNVGVEDDLDYKASFDEVSERRTPF